MLCISHIYALLCYVLLYLVLYPVICYITLHCFNFVLIFEIVCCSNGKGWPTLMGDSLLWQPVSEYICTVLSLLGK